MMNFIQVRPSAASMQLAALTETAGSGEKYKTEEGGMAVDQGEGSGRKQDQDMAA